MTKTWLRLLAFAALGVLSAFAAETQQKNIEFNPNAHVFPHVAIGGVWTSEMTLVNLDPDDEAVFMLRFYKPDGTPWLMTIPGLGTNSEYAIVLPAEASAVYTPGWPGEDIETGSAVIDQPSDAQIAGHIIFTDQTEGRPVFESVVPLSSDSEWYLNMPFDNTAGNVSCIAIANPVNAQIHYSLEFSNNDDELIHIFTEGSLESRNQQSFCLPNEFPETAGERGLIRVTGSSKFLSVLGFRFNSAGAFATMFPMTAERPADLELACYDSVQNTVPWNQNGSTGWSATNVERLCAGTTDTEATIACFSRGIEERDDWRRAITECTYVAPSKLEADCFELVQGRVAWNAEGQTGWIPSSVNLLCADNPNPLATIACFSRGIQTHDIWQQAISECAGPVLPF
jgi:hypothetical protein